MKVKAKYALTGFAAMLMLAAIHAFGQVVIAGSPELYLEAGQAMATVQGCAWDSSFVQNFTLTDTRAGIPGGPLTDIGAAWVTWQPSGGASTCATSVVPGSEVVYISVDSAVGTRCFFAVPQCTVSTTATSSTASGTTLTGISETTMPSAVVSAISAALVSVAATDIRPEDAKFATLRALTGCGYPVVTGSQYLGLGYSNGSKIAGSTHQTNGSGGTFNVANFAITGKDPFTGDSVPTWQVTSVGATPVVVFVNPGDEGGFGSLFITNINRELLAGFLDGTYGRASDLTPQIFSNGVVVPTTVYLREPLSGAFNTIEYAIPNSVEGQSSQEVGIAALNTEVTGNAYPLYNCTNYPPTTSNTWLSSQNPLTEADPRGSHTSYRARAIGSSNEVKAVLATTDSLGYAFWSSTNFANTTAETAKYLTVDGVDPIQEIWSDGAVPTSTNGLLGNVSLSHVKDGSYPIWSLLRLVSIPSTAGATVAAEIAADVPKYLTASQPDFVAAGTLRIVRSHFSPPGVSYPGNSSTPANGTGSATESGGDVGGLVLTLQSDGDYNIDNGVITGNVGFRQ
jgi:hypothetical protein